jgi:hypothetical protein
VAGLFAATASSAANDAHWLDIEGQIQYSYYTEDARALDNLAAQLDTKQPGEPLQDYYAALAYYRIALTASADTQRAASALDSCIAHISNRCCRRAPSGPRRWHCRARAWDGWRSSNPYAHRLPGRAVAHSLVARSRSSRATRACCSSMAGSIFEHPHAAGGASQSAGLP